MRLQRFSAAFWVPARSSSPKASDRKRGGCQVCNHTLVHFAKGCWDFSFLPTSGLSIKPLRVKLLAGEQKAAEHMSFWVLVVK